MIFQKKQKSAFAILENMVTYDQDKFDNIEFEDLYRRFMKYLHNITTLQRDPKQKINWNDCQKTELKFWNKYYNTYNFCVKLHLSK